MGTMSADPPARKVQDQTPERPDEPGPERVNSAGPDAGPSEAVAVAKKVGKRVIAHPVGKIAAVIIGTLFGLAIEAGVDSTGILGPGVDQLIVEQAAGFANIEAKLEALRNSTDPAESERLAKELEGLVAQQRTYGDRAAEELRGARLEIQRLKEDALAASGATAGADVWLKPGESITVAGKAGNVFAFNRFNYSGSTDDIQVNASGQTGRMRVGDAMEFPGDGGVWKVIFKQSHDRGDGRIGFDIVFVESGA